MTVYVVGHAPRTGPVKIGYAKDVEVRLRSLRRGETCPLVVHQRFSSSRPPADLLVLHSLDGDLALERWLHLRLREFRIEGEWFSLGSTPGEVIATVNEEVEAWSTSGNSRLATVVRRPRVARQVRTPEVVKPVIEEPEQAWDGTLPGISTWVAHTEVLPARRTKPVRAPFGALAAAADQHRAMFCAWVDAGFTEDQALRLLAAAVGK